MRDAAQGAPRENPTTTAYPPMRGSLTPAMLPRPSSLGPRSSALPFVLESCTATLIPAGAASPFRRMPETADLPRDCALGRRVLEPLW